MFTFLLLGMLRSAVWAVGCLLAAIFWNPNAPWLSLGIAVAFFLLPFFLPVKRLLPGMHRITGFPEGRINSPLRRRRDED